jgi:hypothetical protein
MARLPDKTALGNVTNVAPTGSVPHINLSELSAIGNAGAAVGKGIAALGSGLESAGDNFESEKKKETDQNNAVAGIDAQTDYLTKSHALRSELENDPDYQSHPQKFDEKIGPIIDEASAKIPDADFRAKWVARQQLDATKTRLDLQDSVNQRLKVEKLNGIEENLSRQQQIYTDPNATDEARASARQAMDESIAFATKSGIVDPKKTLDWRKTYVQGAQWNEGQTRVESDPAGLIRDLQPIAPAKGGLTGSDNGVDQPGMLEQPQAIST